MSTRGTVIDRLVRACASGAECGVRDVDGRRFSAISPGGLGLLTRHGLWHQAAEQIVQLDAVHPAAQSRFLGAWTRVAFRDCIADDDLAFAFLRKVLPRRYFGTDQVTLYRGQISGQPAQPSWTRQPHIALKFAWCSDANVDAVEVTMRGPSRRRADAVILTAQVPASKIICAAGNADGEVIIDPRGVSFTTEPAEQAAIWIRAETERSLQLAHSMGRLPTKLRHLLTTERDLA